MLNLQKKIPQIGDNDSSKIFSVDPSRSSLDLTELSFLLKKNHMKINFNKASELISFKDTELLRL